MTEKELQGLVVKLATLYGWDHYHTYDSRKCVPGFPDLVLIRPPELLFVELKSNRGRFTKDQLRWRENLEGCGVDYHLWQPVDWLNDSIDSRLRPMQSKSEIIESKYW